MGRSPDILLALVGGVTLATAACAQDGSRDKVTATPAVTRLAPPTPGNLDRRVVPIVPTVLPSTPKPDSKPSVVPNKTAAELDEIARQQILFGFNAQLPAAEAIRKAWTHDTGEQFIEYHLNGKVYVANFKPVKNIPELIGVTQSHIEIMRTRLDNESTGTKFSSTLFVIYGGANQGLFSRIPDLNTRQKVREIQEQTEAFQIMAQINALIEVGKAFGWDMSEAVLEAKDEANKYTQIQQESAYIAKESLAIAKIRLFVGLSPYLDRDGENRISWKKRNPNEWLIPTIKGANYFDGGLLYLVNRSLGDALNGVNSWEDLLRKYPGGVESIPGYQKYKAEFEQFIESAALFNPGNISNHKPIPRSRR